MNSMPKLKSPFVRESINGHYVVTDKIEPGYEWVFEDKDVLPVEKLNGMNVSVIVKSGVITSVWSRSERLIVFSKINIHIIKGVLNSCKKGYCEFEDGQYFGELIGNNKDGYLWLPFIDYCQKKLVYKTYHDYPKTFESISKWFKDDLFSLYTRRTTDQIVKPEGIVFTQPSTGKMAKLRLDMFDWYKGKRHKITK